MTQSSIGVGIPCWPHFASPRMKRVFALRPYTRLEHLPTGGPFRNDGSATEILGEGSHPRPGDETVVSTYSDGKYHPPDQLTQAAWRPHMPAWRPTLAERSERPAHDRPWQDCAPRGRGCR